MKLNNTPPLLMSNYDMDAQQSVSCTNYFSSQANTLDYSIYDVCNKLTQQLETLVKNSFIPLVPSVDTSSTPVEQTSATTTTSTASTLKSGAKQTRPSDVVFEELMEYVFKDEGGYVNSPKDPGGATNMGICKKWYDKVMGQTTLEEFKNLTKEDAKNYYYKEYWVPSGAKKLAEQGNEKLAYAVFDAAIHHGVVTAKNLLKKSNGNAELMTDNRLAYMKGLNVWKNYSTGLQARIDKVEDRLSYMA